MFICFFNNSNLAFDKKIVQTYNKSKYERQPCVDCFQSSFGKSKIMSFNPQEEKQFEKLKQSRNLELSPVAYVVDILNDYFNKKISDAEFAQKMLSETKRAQFIFAKMNSEQIHINKELFKEEFSFADKIGALASKRVEGDALRIGINNSIYDYNKNS